MSDRRAFQTGEEVQAKHPALRLFLVHPDVGLQRAAREPYVSEPDELTVDWLALPVEEQAAREADMVRALLLHAAEGEGARFEAWWRFGLSAPARRVGTEVESCVLEGALTRTAIAVLLADPPEGLLVERDGRLFVEARREQGRWAEVGAWLDPWKRDALLRDLQLAWWEPAQRRREAAGDAGVPAPRDGGRVSRRTRAWIHYGWERRGAMLFAALALVVAKRLFGEVWPSMAATSVVVLVGVFAIGGAVERWYRRS